MILKAMTEELCARMPTGTSIIVTKSTHTNVGNEAIGVIVRIEFLLSIIRVLNIMQTKYSAVSENDYYSY